MNDKSRSDSTLIKSLKIRNRDEILSHGDVNSRKIVLDITEATLQRLDAYERIKSILKLDGDILKIGNNSWDLSKKRHVYLIGSGKAANHMARAVDEVLGDHLTRGIVIVKIAEATDVYNRTKQYVGGHPLPNEDGLRACEKILELVDSSGPDDLFIGVVSGGSSALMSCPVDGITLEDEIAVTDIMLKSGADIFEINAIRRHISKFNGGMLAKRIAERGAQLIHFGISDAVASPATGDISIPYEKYRATPFGPDQTTLDDARRVIREYGVEDILPRRVVDYLMNAGPEAETPKAFPQNTYYLINTLPDACRYAKEIAEGMGIKAHILTSFLQGEGGDVGAVLASVAREIQTYANPFPAPCVIIASGEASTKIAPGDVITGHGGPSQEETLGFAMCAADSKAPGACLLSIDSEGTDGTTDVAGGITDSTSYAAAVSEGLDIRANLRGHASYEVLKAIGDTVFTGNTGTNLCDFNVMYVPKKQ
ncbi:MAG: DUF4147 domain-containing protein [Lachnospiraceae bacterium]|nr:DUF4147 domain-containing protein [Lachnospiraceae bacterium]